MSMLRRTLLMVGVIHTLSVIEICDVNLGRKTGLSP